MKHNTFKTLFLSVIFITLAATGAAAWWAYTQHYRTASPSDRLAAGLAITGQSNTKINVLSASTDTESGQTLTQSNQILPGTAQIALVSDSTPAQPAVFDENAARLGTTLSLLLSTWGQGGALPHQLANSAAQLAEKTGSKALASAAADLRRSTPREGPATLALLLVEMDKALSLQPPKDLPQTDSQAEAEKSWFRKQLEAIVHISATPSSQDSWSRNLLTSQQMIARGAVADAANMLEGSPLNADNRLDTLRRQVRTYLLQNGRLNHTITTYANTFLTAR